MQAQRAAADKIAVIEQTAGTQIHEADEKLRAVEQAAREEKARLEAVCNELRCSLACCSWVAYSSVNQLYAKLQCDMLDWMLKGALGTGLVEKTC